MIPLGIRLFRPSARFSGSGEAFWAAATDLDGTDGDDVNGSRLHLELEGREL